MGVGKWLSMDGIPYGHEEFLKFAYIFERLYFAIVNCNGFSGMY